MAAGSSRSRSRSSQAGCQTFFVAHLAEARRLRAVAARRHHLRAQRHPARQRAALRRDQRAPGDRQPRRARRVGCVPRRTWLVRRRGAAFRYRHEPARPSARRSAGARGAREGCAEPRHHAGHEPLRLRGRARSSAQRHADPCASARSARCSAASRPRSPIRPASFSVPPAHFDLVRPGVALYGGNPTPGDPTRCGRWSS